MKSLEFTRFYDFLPIYQQLKSIKQKTLVVITLTFFKGKRNTVET